MSYKRNTTIPSVGSIVNVLATIMVVFLISAGYVGAIAEMPVTI